MKLIVISGLSGSGKTVALHTLEDEDYFCTDNLPPALLPGFVAEFNKDSSLYNQVAVGIDARSNTDGFQYFPQHLEQLRQQGIDVQVIFLHADDEVLIKRFSETRRLHPLSHDGLPLIDAIVKERQLLSVVQENADLVVDSTSKTIHQLRQLMIDRVRTNAESSGLSILFQSFGFKHGVPGDTDFIFDVRCLPNPHWVQELRPLTGLDSPVQSFLSQQVLVSDMISSIETFLAAWLPQYEAENRRYMTISVGCNGGQHRSVYICEKLAGIFRQKSDNITVRHRELS